MKKMINNILQYMDFKNNWDMVGNFLPDFKYVST